MRLRRSHGYLAVAETIPGHPALRAGELTREAAEGLYEEGREVVVDVLLDLDRRLLASRRAAAGRGDGVGPPVLPERFDTVTLIPPSGERIPAHVCERDGDGFVLVVLTPVAPFTGQELREMVLEHAVPEGRVCLKGRTSCPDRDTPEVLRVESPCVIDVLQQRKFLRVEAVRVAHILLDQCHDEPTETSTVNIGAGGCLLAGPRALAIGTQLQIEVALIPGEPPLRADGRVIHIDERGRPGVVFDSIAWLDRRRLVRFVSQIRLDGGFGPG